MMRTLVFLLIILSARVGAVTGIWEKYTVKAVANGTLGCANANGCWTVNDVNTANKTAGVTQSLTLVTLPTSSYVHNARMKSVTACTGTTTLTGTLGITGTTTLFISTPYDLMAAVANTNLTSSPLAAVGNSTTASVALVVGIISTVSNIDQVAAGCSWNVWIERSVLP